MPPPRYQIAICGGGITGLAFANMMLRNPDISVRVYEGASKFEEIGAGLGVWQRVANILAELGIGDEFQKKATWPPKGREGLVFELRASDNRSQGHRFGEWSHKGNVAAFHRAHLLELLVKHVPDDHVRFGARVESYEEDPETGKVTIKFTDGTTATCDLLVGADGIKSAIRKTMFRKEYERTRRRKFLDAIDPVWTGISVYRTLVPSHKLFNKHPEHSVSRCSQNYCGKDKNLIALPIAGGTIVNLAGYIRDPSKEYTVYSEGKWVKEVPQQELLEQLKDFESDVQSLLQFMNKPTKWALHVLKPLPFFTRGRVILLGDAAHAMCPFLGIGGGMGIEDAYVLSHLLNSPCIDKENLGLALWAYDQIRLEPIGRIMESSERQGYIYGLQQDRWSGYTNDLPKLLDAIEENMGWIADWDVKEDIQRGLELIAQRLRRP